MRCRRSATWSAPNPKPRSPALENAGCPVDEFEAEDGKIEAKCKDAATGKAWEIYIDPQTGVIEKMTEID